MKILRLLPLIILFFIALACIEDTIQLEDISQEINYERQIVLPVLKGSLKFDDLAGHGYDSLIITSGDTIFLYLLEDVLLEDTIELGDMGQNVEFEFIEIHCKNLNIFPVGLDLRLYLHNDSISENIDTIWFSDTPGELFIQPAPSDANGLAIESAVVADSTIATLDTELIDKLLNEATRLVLFAEVPSTGGFVKILRHHRLYLNIGIIARGTFISDSE